MNGIHDLGGMHGFGAVVTQADEPVFRYGWEPRTMGMFPALAASIGFGVDEFRHAVERIGAVDYLQGTYYEHWLHAFETLLLEKGVVTRNELERGKPSSDAKATPALSPSMVADVLKTGASARVTTVVPPRFKVGDKVRTVRKNPVGHTRLPRYVRGCVGHIALDHGVFVTPDTIAHGLGEHPQHVYSVSFTAQALWGSAASACDTVRIDLWDDYLEKVGT